jgi:hypothetical protein
MCLEKVNVIRLRWVFQISVWYKSNAGEKIIPTRLETKSPIFSRRERERVKSCQKNIHQAVIPN